MKWFAGPVYQRLLRNRIVFLGQEVDDEIGNRICSELLLLSAEDPNRDIYLYRIAVHTGRPVEQIQRDSDRDRWFTAVQARDYGFIDHVIQNASQVDRPLP